jgi:hypothetical protein
MKAKSNSKRLLTTTLPVEILRELDQAAKETGLRKNEILAQAFIMWNENRKKR